MDITKIDKNFAIEAAVDKPDAVFYDANTKPFCIYGVQHRLFDTDRAADMADSGACHCRHAVPCHWNCAFGKKEERRCVNG